MNTPRCASVRSSSSARGTILRACSAETGFDCGCCARAAEAARKRPKARRMGGRLYQTGEGRTLESGEEAAQIAHPELGLCRGGEDATQIGGDGQVPPFVELVVPQPGPAPEHAAAADPAAEHEGDARVPVIGAVRAILP